MSGPMPRTMAQAAIEHAIKSQALNAARNWAPKAMNAAKGNAAANAARSAKTLPAKTWDAISTQVRTALVMLALDTPGDPRMLARQSWESFSDSDRAALAAIARQFSDECKHARCLW